MAIITNVEVCNDFMTKNINYLNKKNLHIRRFQFIKIITILLTNVNKKATFFVILDEKTPRARLVKPENWKFANGDRPFLWQA